MTTRSKPFEKINFPFGRIQGIIKLNKELKMKNVLMLSMLVLVGCSQGGGGGGGSSGGSSVSAPTVTPAPINSVWPLSSATITVTYGSISCSIISTGGVKCYDGNNIITLNSISTFGLTKLVVGTTTACAMIEPNGAAQTCSSLSSSSCTAPATSNLLYCWNLSDMSVVQVFQNDNLGFSSPTYNSGPKNVYVASNGNMCVVQSTYLSNGTFSREDTVCGNNIHSWGYIQ